MNIDEPEIKINLNSLDAKRKIDSFTIFEDFAFSNNHDDYDCGLFSIFFMNNWGDIYYQCPFVLNGMKVPKETIDFLKKRIEHEKKDITVEKELIQRIESFLNSLEKALFVEENEPGYYFLNTITMEIKENVLQG